MGLKVEGRWSAPRSIVSDKAAEAAVATAVKTEAAHEDLLKAATSSYQNFQRSWFEFAKNLAIVRDSEAWVEGGHESFKAYCAEVFGDLTYSTIVKFMKVIDAWGGAIAKRIAAAPTAPLPSYVACYEFITHEKDLPKAEAARLRKDILEGKFTLTEVREKVEPFLRRTEDATLGARAREIKKVEDEVERSLAETKPALAAAKAGAPIPTPVAEPEIEDVDVEADLADNFDEQAEALLERVRYIKDNLPVLAAALTSSSVKVVRLAEELEALCTEEGLVAHYLNRVSEVAGSEEDETEEGA